MHVSLPRPLPVPLSLPNPYPNLCPCPCSCSNACPYPSPYRDEALNNACFLASGAWIAGGNMQGYAQYSDPLSVASPQECGAPRFGLYPLHCVGSSAIVH